MHAERDKSENDPAEPANARSRFRLLRSAIVVLMASILFSLFVISQVLMVDDSRVHMLGTTFIFHKNGEIAIRFPTDRLLDCHWFESGNLVYVAVGASAILILGLGRLAVRDLRDDRDQKERGFPLD
jgi:hypothetical protein